MCRMVAGDRALPRTRPQSATTRSRVRRGSGSAVVVGVAHSGEGDTSARHVRGPSRALARQRRRGTGGSSRSPPTVRLPEPNNSSPARPHCRLGGLCALPSTKARPRSIADAAEKVVAPWATEGRGSPRRNHAPPIVPPLPNRPSWREPGWSRDRSPSASAPQADIGGSRRGSPGTGKVKNAPRSAHR